MDIRGIFEQDCEKIMVGITCGNSVGSGGIRDMQRRVDLNAGCLLCGLPKPSRCKMHIKNRVLAAWI